MPYGFVILVIPGLVLSLLELFGREGADREERWAQQSAGLALVALGALFVLGYV